MCDHQMHMGQEQLDSENFESFEDLDREGTEQELLGSQPSHCFSDGANFCIDQTFSSKSELKLLLSEAAARKFLILLR